MTDVAGVRQRDGSVEPFDADRICAVLFAVGEGLGRPDAFLARELTDGVVHFLASEYSGEVLPVADVREQVVKVVRELGHPNFALAYEAHTTPRAQPHQAPVNLPLFAREIVSAHDAELLVLGGLDTPTKLAARVLPWPQTARDLGAALAQVRAVACDPVILDGPEYWLGHVGMSPEDFVAVLAGCPCVLNLNVATPPPALGAIAPGPLFGAGVVSARAGEIAARLVELYPGRIVWHLREKWETVGPTMREFVFDRGKRGIHLAEGVDRDAPDLLLRVGVRLHRLLGDPLQEPTPEPLLSRVGTLARLALTAGVQKRAYLRRHGVLTEGFALDRARLQVVPLGLAELVEGRTRRPLIQGGATRDLARRVVQRLRDVLRTDGRKVLLATCLDDFPDAPPMLGVGGLSVASTLQEVSERGTLLVRAGEIPLAQLATSHVDRVRLVSENAS